MSRRDDRISIQQMLDHVEEAVALAAARTRADLGTDRMFFLALVKLVEIAGEAATRVSEPLRAAHPEVPWREVVGIRNRFVHGYDAVDDAILWHVVTQDFPPLAERLRGVRDSLSPPSRQA